MSSQTDILLHRINLLSSVLHRIDCSASGTLRNQISEADQKTKREMGQFEYIPLSNPLFIDICYRAKKFFEILKPGRVPKFLDVGCGIGSKLAIAIELGFDSYGIEFTAEYIKKAKELFRLNQILKADALECNYSGYEVIYFYRPLFKPDEQRKLEEKICRTADEDTLILPMGSHSFQQGNSNIVFNHISQLDYDIWLKMNPEFDYGPFLTRIKSLRKMKE